MPNQHKAPDDLTMRMETEDDVEGHAMLRSAPDDLVKATDDDVEGHDAKKFKAPEGAVLKATDDDVEGHDAKKLKAPDDLVKATDDVEGHMIGAMNPIMARELARAKERDVQRATSRGNLISEAKRAVPRKD